MSCWYKSRLDRSYDLKIKKTLWYTRQVGSQGNPIILNMNVAHLTSWGASQRKICVTSSSGKIRKDPYRVECIDENNTLSIHYPYTQISPIHTKKWTLKTKHPFHTFYEMDRFHPLFVCTHFHTTLPFQTPFPHKNLDELATPLFPQPASPGIGVILNLNVTSAWSGLHFELICIKFIILISWIHYWSVSVSYEFHRDSVG